MTQGTPPSNTAHPEHDALPSRWNGPVKCSGLEVVRYDEASIAAELGPHFVLRDSKREIHQTPWGTEQRFIYFRFEHVPFADGRVN
jgi:hypothetical protein